MYRNIVYDAYNGEVTLFTWNGDGQRVTETEPFKPYLYVEDKAGVDATSIYGNKLRKIEFENIFKRRDFEKASSKTFYNVPPEQQYLIDKFQGMNKSRDFSRFPLKTYFLDIETYSKNGFPDPTKANDPINLISVWDNITERTYTFGLQKEYFTTDETVVYRCYETELQMIRGFLRFWRKDFPDVVSGWYSDGFDLPYICNRINRLYDDPKAANRLSPVNRVYMRENVERRLARYDEIWTICGITHLDYQYIYKVFTRQQKASYSLNNVSDDELGMGKLGINAVSLTDLADNDWHKFVDYNIQDVRLLVFLEDKLQFLQTCKDIAYRGLSPLPTSTGTTAVVTGLAAQKAIEKGRVISTFTPSAQERYEGGFVKHVQRGFQKSLLYFDANSLYPNTIVTLNVSPETKLGKITGVNKETGDVSLTTVRGVDHVLTAEKFKNFIKSEQIAISDSKVLFTQKKRGMFSDIVEEIYADRVKLKDQLAKTRRQKDKTATNDLKHKELSDLAKLLDLKQYTTKILLNRIYGYFAERHSPMYDIQLASSITSTGQACIKKAAEVCETYIKDTYGLEYDPIIMSDTDSVVVTIDPILKKLDEELMVNDKINPKAYAIADDINKEIDIKINEWAVTKLNSKSSQFVFKRENISSTGAFLMKKNYILNIRDDEGTPVDEFIYKGVEVVRSTTPKKIKPFLIKITENIIKMGDPKQTEKLLKSAYEEYQTFNASDIAISKSMNGYEKYARKSRGFEVASRTPQHVKSAIYYHRIIKMLDLENKHEQLKSGSKIKTLYVHPNKYGIDTIAFLDIYPEEFKDILKTDYQTMFEKTVLKPIYRILDAIEWRVKTPLLEEKVDLFDLLS